MQGKRARALEWMLLGAPIADIASLVGVQQSAVRRWCRTADFSAELLEQKQRLEERRQRAKKAGSSAALATLEEIALDRGAAPRARVSAALALFELLESHAAPVRAPIREPVIEAARKQREL